MAKYWIAVVAAALLCFVGSAVAIFFLMPAKNLVSLVGPFAEPEYVEGRFQEGKVHLDKAFPNGLGFLDPIFDFRPNGYPEHYSAIGDLQPSGYYTEVSFTLMPREELKHLSHQLPGGGIVEGIVHLEGGWIGVIEVHSDHREQFLEEFEGLIADGYSIEWEDQR